jgi:hypothetical protein
MLYDPGPLAYDPVRISRRILMTRTRKSGFRRLRLTIGLTPVSLGSSRTNEKPSFRIFSISATSFLLSGQEEDTA